MDEMELYNMCEQEWKGQGVDGLPLDNPLKIERDFYRVLHYAIFTQNSVNLPMLYEDTEAIGGEGCGRRAMTGALSCIAGVTEHYQEKYGDDWIQNPEFTRSFPYLVIAQCQLIAGGVPILLAGMVAYSHYDAVRKEHGECGHSLGIHMDMLCRGSIQLAKILEESSLALIPSIK